VKKVIQFDNRNDIALAGGNTNLRRFRRACQLLSNEVHEQASGPRAAPW
jgi:hypothetical protein